MPLSLDDLLDQLADRGIDPTRPWSPPPGDGPFLDGAYALGMGGTPLEVCIVPAGGRPKRDAVRDLWKTRQGRQASPLLLICPFSVNGSDLAHTCGPGEQDMAVHEVDLERALGLAIAALKEPTGPAAVRYLREHAPSETQDFAGLRNMGMFAAHTLHTRVRDRADWADAAARGQQLRDKEGRGLITALGFAIDADNSPVSVLRAPDDKARGVAVFLDRGERYEATGGRFGDSSALSLAFTRADRDNIPFVVLTRGPQIRLYAASGFQGVGRKGQAETYIQADLGLLAADETGYVPLIFSAEALAQHGSFGEILAWSKDFSAGLSERLRQRVYDDVVPGLAVAIANQHAAHDHDAERDLDSLYEETLVVLFRLLFLAYAEDRDLLPYRSNQLYQRNALKTIARELATFANDGKTWQGNTNTNLWTDVTQLFEAVDRGNDAWGVPLYNGGLFASDPEVSQIGAAIAAIKIPDEQFASALTALLTEPAPDGVIGPVDFRSLSVRDFGTIYEGLLESSLSVATTDLVIDARGNYVPARQSQSPKVSAGEIYHHNRSGARKATGSYFTKDFAVEHLLDHALEPALTEHLNRVKALLHAGDDDLAAQAVFDFRCADLSMGSGHFLVAAVDHIERRIAQFLDESPITGVDAELDLLRAAAIEQLGDSAAAYEIERRQLLRRQVARRCVYGVDLNHVAVELARLSLWVHTFVPGLPLSFLDHNLIQGDSLTGVGSIEEAADYLTKQASGKLAKHGQGSVFEAVIYDLLDEVKEPLVRLARASDATKAELAEVRQAADDARRRAEPVRKLLDLIVAMRLGDAQPFTAGVTLADIEGHPDLALVTARAQSSHALHFPVVFPEVFLRDRPGFDCVIGNPPWDKVRFEPTQFWVTRDPGLQSLSDPDQKKRIATLREERPLDAADEDREKALREDLQRRFRSAYAEQGTGHYDYSKLFVERILRLLARDGHVGVVLPRQALVLGGWAKLRQMLLSHGRLLAFQARNKGGWMFDDVEHRYMVVLLVCAHTPAEEGAEVWPAAKSPGELAASASRRGLSLTNGDIDTLSDSAVLPWFDDAEAIPVFKTMAQAPRLRSGDSWVTAVNDTRWDFSGSGRHGKYRADEPTPASWRVLMTRHVHAFRLDQDHIEYRRFVPSPQDLIPLGLGVEVGPNGTRLAEDHPAIIVRFPSRNDDARTVIAAPLPEQGFLYSAGYAHGLRHGQGTDIEQILALLAYVNSYTCDWWARRFVDRHVTAPVINNLPLPNWSPTDISTAAGYAATLCRRYGVESMPGGRQVPVTHDERPDEAIRADIERLVLAGYGLEDRLPLIMADFSSKGANSSILAALEL